MYPQPFEYVRAESVGHALELLAQHGADARPLAGGQSLLPLMKQRLATPRVVVDIGRLGELAHLDDEGGPLRIGGLVTHAAIEARDWPEPLALLRDAASVIGDVQVRNLGTVGGALAHADPVGDWGPVLQALGASVRVRSSRGERAVPVAKLFTDAFSTVLEPDELITGIDVPAQDGAASGAYVKLARRVGDAGVASVAVQVRWGSDGTCASAAVAVGAAGAVPFRAAEAEAFLWGRTLDDETNGEAARLVQAAVTPFSDVRGSAEYRRDMVRVAVARALTIASRRHSGASVEAGYG